MFYSSWKEGTGRDHNYLGEKYIIRWCTQISLPWHVGAAAILDLLEVLG